jgi:hypothetical protein
MINHYIILRGATSPNTLSPNHLPTLPSGEESHSIQAESVKNSCLPSYLGLTLTVLLLYVQKILSAHSVGLKKDPVDPLIPLLWMSLIQRRRRRGGIRPLLFCATYHWNILQWSAAKYTPRGVLDFG